MNSIRTATLVLVACLGASAVHAAANFVPLTAQTPFDLKYAGSITHTNGTAHTFLARTLAECDVMLDDSEAGHIAHSLPNCSEHLYSRVECTKRGFFELSAPTGGTGTTTGVTTLLLHLPNDFVRAVGDLRERYRIDAYEAERAKLSGE